METIQITQNLAARLADYIGGVSAAEQPTRVAMNLVAELQQAARQVAPPQVDLPPADNGAGKRT